MEVLANSMEEIIEVSIIIKYKYDLEIQKIYKNYALLFLEKKRIGIKLKKIALKKELQ